MIRLEQWLAVLSGKNQWEPVGWRIGRLSERLSGDGYSACGRCHTNWAWVHGHATEFKEGYGMFPLCERCWSDLTPAERLPHYRRLYDQWVASGSTEAEWPDIERAVLAGG